MTWWVSRLPFTLTLQQDLFIRNLVEGICPLKQEMYAKNTGFGWLSGEPQAQSLRTIHADWYSLYSFVWIYQLADLCCPKLLLNTCGQKLAKLLSLTRCSLLHNRPCLNLTKETFLTSPRVLNSSQNASGCDTAAVTLLSTPEICIQMEHCLIHIFIFFDFLDKTQYNIFQDKHGYIFNLELLQCVLK